MSLLKNIKTGFAFEKILAEGYEVEEGPDTKAKIKYANGKRKRVYSNYEDCIIEVKLGGIDATDAKRYIDNLVDGPYEYWSIAHQEYRRANFLINRPSITVENYYSEKEYYLADIKIKLEKSSDIV